MKKSKKIILTILILVVAFMAKGVNATAFYNNEKFTKSAGSKASISGLKIHGLSSYYGSASYTHNKYNFTDPDGESYVGYCMDPNRNATNNYKVKRILGDSTNSKQVQAFDLGMLEIIKNGYNQYNTGGDDLYIATSIAVRAYALGLFGFSEGGAPSQAESQASLSAHVGLGVKWASYHKEKVEELTKAGCSSSSDFSTCFINNYLKRKRGLTWYNGNYYFDSASGGAEALRTAKELFDKGLEKAYEVMTDQVTTAMIENGKVTNSSKYVEGDSYYQYYYVDIKFENFDAEEGKITNVKFDCPTCSSKGITVDALEYQADGGEWSTVDASANLLDAFSAGDNGKKSGTITLRFKATRTESEDTECQTADFTITYDYNDPSLEYVGALLIGSDVSYAQRFYIIQKNEGDITETIEGVIKCSNSCETEISLPVCSLNEKEATSVITGPTKIKTCIIDNYDDAGNDYNLIDDNNGITKDTNPYCSVYCKEDYAEIRFQPIIEDVKCGGYFQLKSFVDGTKTCYTGSPNTDEDAKYGGKNSIDKEQYLEDIKNKQQEFVDMMNQYYEYKAKSEHSKQSSTDSCTCGGSNCGSMLKIEVKWESYDKVTFEWDEEAESGSFEMGTAPAGSEAWEDECNCDSEEKNGETVSVCGEVEQIAQKEYDAWVAEVEAKLQEAITRLGQLPEEYKTIIRNYNACTADWKNEYAFDQKLKYYYDENRGEDGVQYTPYYDLIAEAGDSKMYYLEKDGDETSESTIDVCKGTTADKDYECTGEAVGTMDGSVDDAGKDEYNYNSAYGSDVFYDKNYVICSVEKGCEIDERQISQATFIKKTVNKTQNYITPTVFDQIAANGKITITGSYTGEEIQLETLEHLLPTSTSSVGGGVFKLLLEDLGEFYDQKLILNDSYDNTAQDTLGRLIDFDGYNEDKSVAAAQGAETFNGEYICQYINDCRPADCPNCEFECDGENCEWRECPDCTFDCINCIFDLDKLNVNNKVISTTEVISADRTYGYNWIRESGLGELELLTQKADATIKEIEESNEMIYNDKNTDGSALSFSIKMTSEIINEIKSYNKEQESYGGYINDSLTCYDANKNGNTYKNIYCYSDFIDDLLEKYDDNITVSSNRINSKSSRASGTDSSGYWTLWESYNLPSDITERNELNVIGGPSWK